MRSAYAMKPTPRNLVMAALFGGRKSRRPPVGNPTSIVCHGLMDAAGVGFPEAHLDPRAMADLALAGHDVIGFDTIMPEFSVQQEAAALGCTVDWGHRNMMPDVKDALYPNLSPVDIPEHLLEKPSMRVILDALSLVRREAGDRAAIVGKVMGPWTLSYHLTGVERFLLYVGKSGRNLELKDKLRSTLDRLLPVTIAFARAQFQAGADVVVLADHATGDLVGPHHYREYLLPLHKIITSEIGGPLILHVCGNCSDRLELFAEAGFDAYHFEQQIDAKEAVRRVGHQMALVGNIDNANVLYQGSPKQVRQQARCAIEAGVSIIGPECAIPLETPIENLKAIVEAADEGY